jgi:hypothetical protein
MDNTLILTLADSTEIRITPGSYIVEQWYNGKWNNICAFPYTNEGKAMAYSMQAHLGGESKARIEQFF